MKKLWIFLCALASLAPGARAADNSPAKVPVPERAPSTAPKNITVKEAARLLKESQNSKEIIILDVRTPEEYAAGHIQQAKNLNFYDPQFQQKLARLDKTKPYLVHCASGRRSVKARDILAKLGFQTIYHLEEGFNAWQKAGQPVEKQLKR